MVGSCSHGCWFIQNSQNTLGFPCTEYDVVAWKPLPEPYKSGFEEIKTIDSIIDSEKELKNSERDNGVEPILEEHTSTWHESHSDGTGEFKSRKTLEWKCPNCGWFVGELYCGFGKWHIQGERSYCSKCGQKIDWSKPKTEEKEHYESVKERERAEHLKRTGIKLDNMHENLRQKHGL